MSVRAAQAGDILAVVALAEAERRRYESGLANFYAVAPDYAQQKQQLVARLVEGSEAVTYVHERAGHLDGLILGRVLNAPPVYDPGGKVCLVEDFVVVESTAWPHAGVALTAALNDRVRQLGGVLMVVECMHAATAKRDLLFSLGFSIASDWYCRDIDLTQPEQGLEGVIEPADAGDVPAIVHLCERRRLQYERYQPVFWRKAAESAEKHGGFLSWLISEKRCIALVHRTGTEVDGFIFADPFASSPLFARNGTSCNIDDFTVVEDNLWPIGAWLLYMVTAMAKDKGAVRTQVVCGDADLSKRRMLEQMGYQIGHEWFVRATSPEER